MPEPAVFESVPNFSEGRDPAVMTALAAAAAGAHRLDLDCDGDHNRTILSLAAGDGESLCDAVFDSIAAAVELIDLRRHTGVHPRIGVADVAPIVPLGGARLDDCVDLARRLGERVWRVLRVPVHLYGAAATSPERASLAAIRSGRLAPDLGAGSHPTAGACCVGARPPLVAYNVILENAGLAQGAALARSARQSSGGLGGVQALAFELPGGRTQLSMNLFDLRRAPPDRVLAEVGRLAAASGIRLGAHQVAGLCPAAAAGDAASGRLLEARLAGAAAAAGAARCRELGGEERTLLGARLDREAAALNELGASPEHLLAGGERAAALLGVLEAAGCLSGDLEMLLRVAVAGFRAGLGDEVRHRFPERAAALDRRLSGGTG
ncbi:MAG: glutamate formimidoyltransferase [Candidatus Dormibacteraceae bacterium]